MIHLIPTEAKRFRTFGWVQDPSDFRSLCDVVAIFDETSLKHQELAGQVIPASWWRSGMADRDCWML